MTFHKEIVELYSELVDDPGKDLGWDKGWDNAEAHGYSSEWFEALPEEVWDYCAAVGNPFMQGDIRPGDTVVDLGCGAGTDLLVSALLTGKKGKAIGIDITPKMVEKAREHARMAGLDHVEVMEGDLESILLEDNSVDVVISNGAINLTKCKESVFAEIYRILKPNGRLFFADIIDITEPKPLSFCTIDAPAASCCTDEPAYSTEESTCSTQEDADWANCVAGTLKEQRVIEVMQEAGLDEVECTGLTGYKTSLTTMGATFRAIKSAPEVRRKRHWEKVFETKDYRKVLWHQDFPELSIGLMEGVGTLPDEAIIDVGCGASLLADRLIEKGYRDLTLLDVSETSLQIVKDRLGMSAKSVKFISTDITKSDLQGSYDLWHDRALFHFLLEKHEREEYVRTLYKTLAPGGTAIIGTFAIDGPISCSDLDIIQYDRKKMEKELLPGLRVIKSQKAMHRTPQNREQAYHYFVIKKH